MYKSEKFWDKSATGYDKEEMKDKEVRIKILQKIKGYLKKENNVLDYGCATGILANEIASNVDKVYGIDISSEMIRIAQNKANELHIQNVDYLHTTIFDKNYKSGDFDMILAVYMLHLLEDLPKVLERIYELLKPGGMFISVTPCLGKKSLTGIGLSLVSKIGLIPKLKTYTVSELENSIKDTGFEIFETECLHRRGQQHFIAVRKN
ncbi:class I SAM-dependent methyltransferase [Aquimarina megaterium]|uniref:class I SAM-dependent methyltransferase n=1 Tax=Aquimarina megaterium TaxID=1443666 RepID=UPI0004712E67|nr:class I SAM-dependent methyltransferase [Aquimarina megaterium]